MDDENYIFRKAHRRQHLCRRELQTGEMRERIALQNIRKEPYSSQSIPYGVLLYTCVIRDLTGVGFEHVGAKGQEIIQAVVGIAAANYPGEQSTFQ